MMCDILCIFKFILLRSSLYFSAVNMHDLFHIASVVLQIVELVDVPALLSLRVVNKSLNHLITCYQPSTIKNLAINLGLIDNKEQFIDFGPAASNQLKYIFRLQLAHRLAIKAVASDQVYGTRGPPILKGIPPDDTLGDEIRRKVQTGLLGISALSHIYKEFRTEFPECDREPPGKSRFLWFGRWLSARKEQERELLRRWREYCISLSEVAVTDLIVALWCIRGKSTFDHQTEGSSETLWSKSWDNQWNMDGSQWMTNYLTRNGLHLIDDLWSDDASVSSRAKARIRADCGARFEKEIRLETSIFNQLLRFYKEEGHPMNAKADGIYYYISTFVFRIGPYHNGLSPDQLTKLRREAAEHFVISNPGH